MSSPFTFIGRGFERYARGCNNQIPASLYAAVMAADVTTIGSGSDKVRGELELRSGPHCDTTPSVINPVELIATRPHRRLFSQRALRTNFPGTAKQARTIRIRITWLFQTLFTSQVIHKFHKMPLTLQVIYNLPRLRVLILSADCGITAMTLPVCLGSSPLLYPAR